MNITTMVRAARAMAELVEREGKPLIFRGPSSWGNSRWLGGTWVDTGYGRPHTGARATGPLEEIMVKDSGYLAFALMVLGVVVLSWIFSGCGVRMEASPAQAPGLQEVLGDAGVEELGDACVQELIPCPEDPEEAFLCGCGVPCPEAQVAWCGGL